MFDAPYTDHAPATRRLFDFDLVDAETDAALSDILSGARRRIAFLNADCVNLSVRDSVYRRALQTADRVLPDGSGLSLAAKMQGFRFTENLNGTDLFPHLCRRAAIEGKSIFLLGGRPGVAAAAGAAAQALAPGLRLAGARHGYFGEADEDAVIAEINAAQPDILLVGLGAPRQDAWLARHGGKIAATVQMGVGGLFDYYSGRIPRAPLAMRRVGMEWVWRLMMEPRRLAHRYLVGNPLFVARAAREAAAAKGGEVAKRVVDIAGAGLGLLALSPLFLLIAAAIRLESRGPAFYVQTRVGRGGRTFRMLKFRTMRQDAEARRTALLADSDRSGVCFKSRTDPRITSVGRVLRRASIDELPQLINILRGEMSVIGPRPALPVEVAAFSRRAHRRHDVKPGLTGLWQVSGRADIGFERMIELDLAYAKARSPLLDAILLFLTLRAVVSGKGAY